MRPIFAIKFNNAKGMTLLEIIITILILGILSSISIPHFASWLAQNEEDASLEQIKLIIEQTKQQAKLISKSCQLQLVDNLINDLTVYKNSTDKKCLSGSTETATIGTKIVPQVKLSSGIKIHSNLANNILSISFRGIRPVTLNKSQEQPAIIVLEKNGKISQKCLLISPRVGLIRSGIYKDKNWNEYNAENFCQIIL
ncbi:prepilin-type N-terminal cleavage/methylation domain-containing protein [Gloeothece verrucosa]|uniref:Prepilin-type N-terminal cleavage/methylation domain-containing protein n=1 Tax=Gloeothece verrucosa (strain PCC 7822) TaxID=497965 RepID=E0ULC6_GLOV7|nr:prepilin-type N-terminal cleavage/methylation domain-containing protein [Gloeothece verrucosa]ADN17756.1 hypothetical protein Cyan7822_5902 [Gloeothece verrucosa PCC 7822]